MILTDAVYEMAIENLIIANISGHLGPKEKVRHFFSILSLIMISHINLDIQKFKMFRLFPSDTCASDKDVNILHHHVNLDNSESIHAKQNIKRRKVILKIKYLKLGKR